MSGAHPAPELPATRTSDVAWFLVEEGFNLAREHEIESLFTVANGYTGTRGSLAEGSPLSSPATVVAGLFAVPRGPDALPELALVPDWTHLQCFVALQALRLEDGETLEHRRVLDLRQGILWRDWRHRDPAGRVSFLRGFRLASLADRHLLIQSITFTAENYGCTVRLEGRTEPSRPPESSVAPPGPELVAAETASPPPKHAPQDPRVAALSLRTEGTGQALGLASASELRGAEPERVHGEVESGPSRLVERWSLEVERGETCRLDHRVSIYTSRESDRPTQAAGEHLERSLAEGIEHAVAAHVLAWERRWHGADVRVDGDETAQHALRFACYHLISACNPEDERASIGARALTGWAYLGHVFWDTELFMLPFYVLTHPPSARALLMYRYHTLPAAREKARALGYRGALYAWESADTGREVTPGFVVAPGGGVLEIRNGELEIHISAAIAYGVCQYWHATGDERFLLEAGAEIVLETARFWASRGQMEADGRYHLRHVTGPDEYHEDVDDNAYTNLTAQWNLERGVEMARLLAERWPDHWRQQAARLGLDAREIESWERMAAAMYTGFNPATGLYEQFQGYFGLEEIDLAALEPRTTAVDVLLGRERIQRSTVLRQADVVMAVYLLWDRLTPEVREANFRYYEPRTAHGSSLSPGIHALVAARLGELEVAGKYFRQTAEIDLANNMGNAAGGVHAAALGGLWQTAVFGYGGLRIRAKGPALDPRLPPDWTTLSFPFEWRGQRARVTVGGTPVAVELQLEGEDAAPLTVTLGEHPLTLEPHRQYRSQQGQGGWGPWQEVRS